MEKSSERRTQKLIAARNQNPAWQLLASRKAPLILACLQSLFEHDSDGLPVADALQALSDMLASHANQEVYEIDADNTQQQAGRELRAWIKRALIVERDDRLYATDALERAMKFVDSLDSQFMTSTASRLSVVQREIENLEIALNPNPTGRIESLRRKIQELEHELEEAKSGNIPVLNEAQAIEGIREVFALATGLRADFRRVEDSWRIADRELRQSIISEQYHRGEIVDQLLEGHTALLNTPEGRVFDSFQRQLRQTIELEHMKERLRVILKHASVHKALSRNQQSDLRWLVMRLVKESQAVFQARARSEKDVKAFLKTGLAAEHHRVGNLLSEILNVALKVDWQRQAVRHSATPLPPVAFPVSGIPLVERLRFKVLDDTPEEALKLSSDENDLTQLDDEFWMAFDGLDREALIRDTLAVLAKNKKPMSIAELARELPPVQDLETFALWLGMAKEAGIELLENEREEIVLYDEDQRAWKFRLPGASFSSAALENIEWEI